MNKNIEISVHTWLVVVQYVRKIHEIFNVLPFKISIGSRPEDEEDLTPNRHRVRISLKEGTTTHLPPLHKAQPGILAYTQRLKSCHFV